MEKFNFKNFRVDFKKFFNNLGKVIIIVVAMSAGYAASEIYNQYESSTKTQKMGKAKTIQDTKVYMNGNELMLMDIKTGAYQLYDKEIINVIFSIKANQMFNENVK